MSTVREAIAFSGRMRLPQKVSNAELQMKVKNVLEVLGLAHLSEETIGFPGMGGVSPEVRKKVTIGVELIAEPSILFLDEPTTGLDSAGAYAVMSAVHTLSKHMAVVCTVHQPSMELTKMVTPNNCTSSPTSPPTLTAPTTALVVLLLTV